MIRKFEEFSSVNKNKANQFLITLPQWEKIQDYKEWCHTKLPPRLYTAICAEKHENGGNHHHIVMHTKTKISKSQLLSRFQTLFPEDYGRIDVKNIRKDTISHVIDYINKEDAECWTEGEIPKGGRPKKRTEITYVAPWIQQKSHSEMADEIRESDIRKMDFKMKWNEFAIWVSETFGKTVDKKSHNDFNWFREYHGSIFE